MLRQQNGKDWIVLTRSTSTQIQTPRPLRIRAQAYHMIQARRFLLLEWHRDNCCAYDAPLRLLVSKTQQNQLRQECIGLCLYYTICIQIRRIGWNLTLHDIGQTCQFTPVFAKSAQIIWLRVCRHIVLNSGLRCSTTTLSILGTHRDPPLTAKVSQHTRTNFTLNAPQIPTQLLKFRIAKPIAHQFILPS